MDTELEAEQAYVDDAYRWLEWMRERAVGLAEAADRNDLDILHALRRRAASLTDGGRPLYRRQELDRVQGDRGARLTRLAAQRSEQALKRVIADYPNQVLVHRRHRRAAIGEPDSRGLHSRSLRPGTGRDARSSVRAALV